MLNVPIACGVVLRRRHSMTGFPMARRHSRDRTRRAQRIVAVLLLVSMALSGAALYAVGTIQTPAQQPTQQSL
jgi:hypothetical protein